MYDRLRSEEKALRDEARAQGHEAVMVDAKRARLSTRSEPGDLGLDGDSVVLERCISYIRGLHVTAALESMGLGVVNCLGTATACGNKMLMTLRLARAGVPTPETHFAFTREAASECARAVGLPLVIKPVIGSWGRGVMPLRDADTLDAVAEMRELSDTPHDRVYYLQKMVDRPPRDIRVVSVGGRAVAAEYREAEEGSFATNVSAGAEPRPCEVTPEMAGLAARASEAVGGGVLGIDMMEDRARGGRLVVHEVNNTVEFKGISTVTGANIPGEIVRYAAGLAGR